MNDFDINGKAKVMVYLASSLYLIVAMIDGKLKMKGKFDNPDMHQTEAPKNRKDATPYAAV